MAWHIGRFQQSLTQEVRIYSNLTIWGSFLGSKCLPLDSVLQPSFDYVHLCPHLSLHLLKHSLLQYWLIQKNNQIFNLPLVFLSFPPKYDPQPLPWDTAPNLMPSRLGKGVLFPVGTPPLFSLILAQNAMFSNQSQIAWFSSWSGREKTYMCSKNLHFTFDCHFWNCLPCKIQTMPFYLQQIPMNLDSRWIKPIPSAKQHRRDPPSHLPSSATSWARRCLRCAVAPPVEGPQAGAVTKKMTVWPSNMSGLPWFYLWK